MTINIILTSVEQTCDEENLNKQTGKLFIFDCIYFSTAQTIYFSLFILTAQPTLTPVFVSSTNFLTLRCLFYIFTVIRHFGFTVYLPHWLELVRAVSPLILHIIIFLRLLDLSYWNR